MKHESLETLKFIVAKALKILSDIFLRIGREARESDGSGRAEARASKCVAHLWCDCTPRPREGAGANSATAANAHQVAPWCDSARKGGRLAQIRVKIQYFLHRLHKKNGVLYRNSTPFLHRRKPIKI